MIRAHLATFPERAEIVDRVVEAIRPQVDHLFIVLNGYEAVPEYLRAPGITAIIPDRDVKDAGKFWFTPAPDDIVFLIDDDIGYPPDYVAKSIAQAEAMGWDRGAFAHLGVAWSHELARKGNGWKLYPFTKKSAISRGMDLLGTGTVVARGDMIAPLDQVEFYAGAVDIGYAVWLRADDRELWTLTHDEGWMTNDLPKALYATSLFKTRAVTTPELAKIATRALIGHAPANRDIPFNAFASNSTGAAADPRTTP